MSVHEVPSGWVVRWRQRTPTGHKNRSRTFQRDLGFRRLHAERFDLTLKQHKRSGGIDPLSAERDFFVVVEEWWEGHHLTVSESHQRHVESMLKNRILPFFEGLRLCDVTSPEVDRFRTNLIRSGVGDPTIRKVLYTLSGVFSYAKRMGYVSYNPVDPIPKPGGFRQRLVQPFPPERVEAVRAWFLEKGDLEGATLVAVLAYSGPRPEEAHSILGWGDILENSIIYRASKTDQDRTTRLLAPLAGDLRLWREESKQLGPVFGWSQSRYHNWRARHFRKATEAAGVENTRPYDLRHAFASLLAAEHQSIDYIARQLGHTIPTCDRWYRHMLEQDGEIVDAEERIWEARGVRQTFAETRGTTSP